MHRKPRRSGRSRATPVLAVFAAVAACTVLGAVVAAGGRAAAAAPPPPVAAAPVATAGDQAAGERWWAHVRYLADDKLAGRLTGSAGYRQAAAYVERHFKEYGLAPAGVEGYLQAVPFEVQRVQASASSLALARGGRAEPLALGQDALLGARQPQPPTLEAPLVFAGYALHLPEAGFDDLGAVDCKGKVVVFLNGGPANLPGALKAHARAAQEFTKALQAAGAVGAISLPNPDSMDIPWARQALAASQPGMRIDEADMQDAHGAFFTATFNPERADKLFAGSGHTFAQLLAVARAGKPLPRFPLACALRAKVASITEHMKAPNVAGVLRGADPALASQYVVFSAHLDHLGVGEPIAGDRIYNGAMDNAAGVAALLEVARAMTAPDAPRPRRSVLFLAVCGEEKGLLGSRYFAAHPTVPRASLAADINVDMFLPLFPLHYLTVQGLDESSLGDDARAVGAAMGVQIVADRHPDRNSFIRSDQYSFIRSGVPAVALSFGSAPGSPEEKTQKDWLTQRYHAPSDDVHQPVDLAAAGRFDGFVLALMRRVADAGTRPDWKENSFFRRFAVAAPATQVPAATAAPQAPGAPRSGAGGPGGAAAHPPAG